MKSTRMKKRFILLLVPCSLLFLRAEDLSGVFADDPHAGGNHVPTDYKGKSFGDRPAAIPGTIEAEGYDTAPDATPGITFSADLKPGHTSFRPDPDSVGIAPYRDDSIDMTGKAEPTTQVFVGWTHVGEWLKYTVTVADSGEYILGGKFASSSRHSAISMAFSSGPHTEAMEIPPTQADAAVSPLHTWETLDRLGTIHLDKGTYVMTVTIENQAGLNLDYFTFKKKE
jgi:hypothetical protein